MTDNNLKIISYNIWFENINRIERLYSLFSVIDNEKPDIICLQEVMNSQYEIIKKELSYQFMYPEKIESDYGCVILSKYPIEKSLIINLPSRMKRNLVLAKINFNGTIFVIANVHFESEFNNNNKLKKKQFKYVGTILNKIYYDHSNVILCSDTNVTECDENLFLNNFENFFDAWQTNGSKYSEKFTYDYHTNTNLQLRGIQLRCRIDRILYIVDKNIVCNNFKLLTANELLITNELLIQPSDHHGISANFIF